MTENHNYHTPAKGRENWHEPLNENFRALDNDIEVRDVQANLTNYTAKDGAKFFATDTGATFLADGNSWSQVDGSFNSLNAPMVNNDVYAANFEGNGLASKVENALDWLRNTTAGQGRVVITPKSDGTAWIWDKDVSVDPTLWNGIAIECKGNVEVQYPGSGWALTLDTDWSRQNGNFDIQSNITGGRWLSTGDPKGWLRIRDAYKTYVSPRNVDFENSNNTAVGVAVENYAGWAESTHIADTRLFCDICVDFRPASITGGPGTDSYHGTTLENAKFEVRNVGVRARGTFDYSYIDHCSFFAKGSDVTLLQLGWDDTDQKPRYEATVIAACKFEDPGGSSSNTTAIRLGPNYDGFFGPLILGGKMFIKDGQNIKDDSTRNSTITRLAQRNNGVEIQELTSGGTLKFAPHTLWPGFALQVDAVEIDRYVDLQNNSLRGVKQYSSASPNDLHAQEVAIDTNVGGTGDSAILFKDGSGTVHYWTAEGTL
ncbi:hypothetical protein [Salinigranum salinum]|uniref:hypothetical protein n=1 Tax=Salinigranum salinum TaxID=1364937 RepID=UPI001260DCA6|nr:hypothetical protein [Salinigranum salinum]